jgi:hypothetical protein
MWWLTSENTGPDYFVRTCILGRILKGMSYAKKGNTKQNQTITK